MFCWLVSEMQSAQDDGWIDGFDEKWNRRADSAEKTAKRAAGLEVSACRIAIWSASLPRCFHSPLCVYKHVHALPYVTGGPQVQVVPNPETFEKIVRAMNGLNNSEICPWCGNVFLPHHLY